VGWTVVAGTALIPAVASAVGTLDQQQPGTSSFGLVDGPDSSNFSKAQTFTPQLSGALDQVDLFLEQGQLAGNGVGVTVEIRDVAAGAPGPTVKATTTVLPSAIPSSGSGGAFVSVAFTAPAVVDANTKYAIVARTVGSERYRWHDHTAVANGGVNPYAGGDAATSTAQPSTWTLAPNDDFAFKTYVTALPAMCHGLEATIVGTSGDDVLQGTAGSDVIAGLDGDDEIIGKEGNDLICGGPGEDILKGKAGDDKLKGNADDDFLKGGGGNDELRGSKGRDDLCRGGPGLDLANASCEHVRTL
jgi:Ca2+-binding RTX toxin-like protein